MTQPDPHLEQQVRDACTARAAEVEPSADAYARLAGRVSTAAAPVVWWRRPRMALGVAAAAAFVAVAGIGIASLGGADDPEQVATAPGGKENARPVPDAPPDADSEGVEPLPDATEAPRADEATPTPGPPLAVAVPAGAVAWPGPDQPIFAGPDEAVAAFLAQIVGVADAALDPAVVRDGRWRVDVRTRTEGGAVGAVVATVEVARLDNGTFGVTAVSSPAIVPDSPVADGELAPDGVVTGSAETFEANVMVRLVSPTGEEIARGLGTGGASEPEPFTVTLEPAGLDVGGTRAMLVISGGAGADTDVPPFAAVPVIVAEPPPVATDVPDAVIWPIDDDIYTWPESPQDAADRFLTEILNLGVPVGPVERGGGLATVTLLQVGDDGRANGPAGFIELRRVRDDDGGPHWAVTAIGSDAIVVDDVSVTGTDELAVAISGTSSSVEGNIEVLIVDVEGNELGSGILGGGAGAAGPMAGTVTVAGSTGLPSYVILTAAAGDAGGTAAITVIAVDLAFDG